MINVSTLFHPLFLKVLFPESTICRSYKIHFICAIKILLLFLWTYVRIANVIFTINSITWILMYIMPFLFCFWDYCKSFTILSISRISFKRVKEICNSFSISFCSLETETGLSDYFSFFVTFFFSISVASVHPFSSKVLCDCKSVGYHAFKLAILVHPCLQRVSLKHVY